MRPAALALAAAVAIGAAALAYAQPPAPAPAARGCAPGEKLSYICGLRAPEDLVLVPGTEWIISSGMADSAVPNSGGLYLIDTARKTARKFTLPAAGSAKAPYDKCSGPLDPAKFSAHGLSIRAQGQGRAHLFVVGHGGREAIEVFEVASGSGPPTLSWIGCIPAPPGAFMNSVTTLPDGRVYATNYFNAPATRADVLAGKDTGWVMMWKPGGQFEKLGGTDLPGPNGIEISPDQKSLFVAVTGTSQVLRFELGDTWRAPTFIRPNLRTDNLRWAPDGKLLLAGPGPAPGGGAGTAPAVAALDPATLKTVDVLRIPPDANFPGHAAALIVGKTLWLGTYSGDRVAYTPLP